MFFINVISLFSGVEVIRYIFIGIGVYGLNLCLKKMILNRGV